MMTIDVRHAARRCGAGAQNRPKDPWSSPANRTGRSMSTRVDQTLDTTSFSTSSKRRIDGGNCFLNLCKIYSCEQSSQAGHSRSEQCRSLSSFCELWDMVQGEHGHGCVIAAHVYHTGGRMLKNANLDLEVQEEVRRYVRHLVQVHGCCRRRG